MKRTRLQRGKPLTNGKPLGRTTPLKPVGDAKKRKARYRKAFGDKAAYVRSLPCCACGAFGPSDPHHYLHRSSRGNKDHMVPLCRRHHQEIHGPNSGVETFQRKHGISFAFIAGQIEHDWQALK